MAGGAGGAALVAVIVMVLTASPSVTVRTRVFDPTARGMGALSVPEFVGAPPTAMSDPAKRLVGVIVREDTLFGTVTLYWLVA